MANNGQQNTKKTGSQGRAEEAFLANIYSKTVVTKDNHSKITNSLCGNNNR